AYNRQAIRVSLGNPQCHQASHSRGFPAKKTRTAAGRSCLQASFEGRGHKPHRAQKAGAYRSRPVIEAGNAMIKSLLIAPIRFYRYFLSPWVGHGCRFTPTCSAYAIEAIETHG